MNISLQGNRKGTIRTFTTMKKVIMQKISSYNLVLKNTTNTNTLDSQTLTNLHK